MHHVALVALIGFSFVISANYALVLSSLLFAHGAPWQAPWRGVFGAIIRAAVISIAGFLLSGISSVPLMGHFTSSAAPPLSLHYPPTIADNILGYARMLFPLVPVTPAADTVTFKSLVLLPAGILCLRSAPKPPLPGLMGFHLVLLWGAAYMALSLPAIGPVLAGLYESIPIVSTIRWFMPFQNILQILFLSNAFAVFQYDEKRQGGELGSVARVSLAAFFAASGLLFLNNGIRSGKMPIILAAATLLGAAAYGIASTSRRFKIRAARAQADEDRRRSSCRRLRFERNSGALLVL
jgi:hypothetical protein